MLAAIYARYSSENQRPESIEDQVTACRRLAGQRGFTIVEEHIYSDQAQSGVRKDRPGLATLLSSAQSGQFQVVLKSLGRVEALGHGTHRRKSVFPYWEFVFFMFFLILR